MPTPDTPAYYAVMFGTAVLIPLFLATFCYFSWRMTRTRSAANLLLATSSAVLLCSAIIANPLLNCILFVPASNARVATMHETANREGFVGKTLSEFSKRFGQPDYQRTLRTDDYDLFAYTCRSWYEYGWDELVVFTRNEVILDIHIDD